MEREVEPALDEPRRHAVVRAASIVPTRTSGHPGLDRGALGLRRPRGRLPRPGDQQRPRELAVHHGPCRRHRGRSMTVFRDRRPLLAGSCSSSPGRASPSAGRDLRQDADSTVASSTESAASPPLPWSRPMPTTSSVSNAQVSSARTGRAAFVGGGGRSGPAIASARSELEVLTPRLGRSAACRPGPARPASGAGRRRTGPRRSSRRPAQRPTPGRGSAGG